MSHLKLSHWNARAAAAAPPNLATRPAAFLRIVIFFPLINSETVKMYRAGDHLLIQFPDRCTREAGPMRRLWFFANHISPRCGPVYSLLMFLLFITPRCKFAGSTLFVFCERLTRCDWWGRLFQWGAPFRWPLLMNHLGGNFRACMTFAHTTRVWSWLRGGVNRVTLAAASSKGPAMDYVESQLDGERSAAFMR